MKTKCYILGGAQTDFAYNWSRKGHDLWDILRSTVSTALDQAKLDPHEVQSCHIGNFSSEAFCHQNLLAGMFASVHPDLSGVAAGRHEAACASGSLALLAATAEIEAERFDLTCVMGVEQMRNRSAREAADILGYCVWRGSEAEEAHFIWPYMFSSLVDIYQDRFGISQAHLRHIAEKNFRNARRNPNAQTRGWDLPPGSFSEDEELNPRVEGHLRRYDCSQITDGGAAIFVASERFAAEYARRNNVPLESIPYVKGWGHRTAPLRLADKLAEEAPHGYLFPHVRGAITDAYRRAGIEDHHALDAVEVHDCFGISEYMAVEHFGITGPGRAFEAIEAGTIDFDGALPVNPSGGLMGGGHPIGATGVRMALDAFRQTSQRAGDYQVEDAKTVATLNLGGSTTSTVSLIIGVD